MTVTRRHFLGGVAGLTTLGAFGGPVFAAAQKPASPLQITIVDVAGNLALTQAAFDAYAAAKPDFVSRFVYTKAPSPELPAKLQAQQAAGRVDLDLVLTGTDALAAGIGLNLWVDLKPHMAELPKLTDILLPQAAKMQGLAEDQGIIVSYYPSGPIVEYMPDKVATPPTTAQELLDWTKANPNKFIYARPANSGPGRTFLMGLPYLLGDSDPKDPEKGWDKTWEYLAELGKNVEYYPTGTGAVMKELGEGTRDMTVSTTGWDINPRALGVVPAEAKVGKLQGFHWVTDAHYMCIPKGIADERVAVLLDVMNFMLEPKQQAIAYDQGYFYPGPAVKDVPLSMAPQDSQDCIKEFGRPEYEDWIANNPLELPLDPAKMVTAFNIWDQKIGAAKG
ncbi:MAG: extracellular solute-binding protein [Mesorhizobium sp.]|nr:extracellular solute-binding protein [Mesorhizobium sp.]MBN9245066.1 extracellular solute-binding protein [Mesorhizobium sp.]